MNKRRATGSTSSYVYSALSVIAIAAAGCAGQTPSAQDARAAGQWTFRLPESGSPYAGLAISDRGYQQSGLNLVDDALATSAAKVEAPAAKPRPVTQTRTVVAKATQAEPQPAAAPTPTPAVAVTAQPEQLALATPVSDARDESRYSQREQKSQQQRDFRGGDAIVISASALVIILLVVILILLLT